jgi:hypothetical protein
MSWGNDDPNLGGVSGDGVPRSGPGSLMRTGPDFIGKPRSYNHQTINDVLAFDLFF